MKRPAFQFYPGDWLEDIGLRASSLAARGLWVDMLCFSHQGEPYGHLRRNSRDIPPDELARMVGAAPAKVSRLLAELESHHVFSRTAEGTIYSRRQVRDEALREKRAAFGRLSQGHPDVPKKKDTPKDIDKDRQKDTLAGSIGGSPSSPSPSPPSTDRKEGSSAPEPATPEQASAVALAVLGPPERPPNALVDRDAQVREGHALIPLIAARLDLDPTEVLSKASMWNGHGYVRLDVIPDDRLAHTVNALRSWWRRLEGAPEPGPPQARASPSPAQQRRREGMTALATGGLKGDGTLGGKGGS